jgi:hypothetical protein
MPAVSSSDSSCCGSYCGAATATYRSANNRARYGTARRTALSKGVRHRQRRSKTKQKPENQTVFHLALP